MLTKMDSSLVLEWGNMVKGRGLELSFERREECGLTWAIVVVVAFSSPHLCEGLPWKSMRYDKHLFSFGVGERKRRSRMVMEWGEGKPVFRAEGCMPSWEIIVGFTNSGVPFLRGHIILFSTFIPCKEDSRVPELHWFFSLDSFPLELEKC